MPDAGTTAIPETRAAARGTFTTLLFRLVSFGCTQATFRLLDPSILGKASIQLELLLTTVLFVSREGFRLALTRNLTADNWNVAWLTIPVVLVVALGSLLWHLSTASSQDQDYRLAGILFCIASFIEGCAEPAVLYFLREMNVAKRASAEGVATIVKTFTTILAITHMDTEWQVTAFGIAQISYALTYATYLYSSAWSKLVPPTAAFDQTTCYMTLVFTVQGFFKHVLTEADKIVLTAVSDNYNQGVYAMGSSYGGMAARILLQPLEENARLLWSRLASRKGSRELEESYTTLVKLVLYIGLLFSCVAVSYTNLLLSVLAGRKWGSNTEAANVLSAFCVYTAFLACNGMTEALVYAVATGAEVGRLGLAHTATGLVFAASAFYLVSEYGTIGLVAANCIAMSLRSIYSIVFAARYFGAKESKPIGLVIRRLLGDLSPHPAVLAGFGIALLSTRWTLQKLRAQGMHQMFDYHNKEWLLLIGQHLAVGVSCVIGIASVALATERPFLRSLRSMVLSKRD